MRIAIVHDWLVTYAGAERVLEQILAVYPDGDLFSLIDFVPESERAFLGGRSVRTSFLQRMPRIRRNYRSYLALMPLAVEQFDLSRYDLIISSSYAVAKGVLSGPDQLHLCYCHSPIRYAWDLQHQYLRSTGLDRGLKAWGARYLLHRLRIWDRQNASSVDGFMANSRYIARRIWKVYRREAEVIYPPVDTDSFPLETTKSDYFVAASRLVPYKRMDLIVEAFGELPDHKLVIIGDGPDAPKLKAKLKPNCQWLGYQPDDVLLQHLQQARAFVFAAEEDFGIAPLEAQACGTPVIALGRGGVCETIRGLNDPRPTGVFFEEQTVASLIAALKRFAQEEARILPEVCRENALRFSAGRFRHEIQQYIDHQLAAAGKLGA